MRVGEEEKILFAIIFRCVRFIPFFNTNIYEKGNESRGEEKMREREKSRFATKPMCLCVCFVCLYDDETGKPLSVDFIHER